MAKAQTIFSCSHCDAQYSKWTGRCLTCGKWGSINEEVKDSSVKVKATNLAPAAKATPLTKVTASDKSSRTTTHIGELDRVLGGGLVPGSYLLLGGEPGIGKSTLSLQLASKMKKTLYASAEESISQIQLRANRLGIKTEAVSLIQESNVDVMLSTAKKEHPSLLIIDSIQTVYSNQAESSPGTVGQVRACATIIMDFAKRNNITTLVIGHVTKDGNVAGPKTLEHLVDTVLYLEGEKFHNLRMLRSVKNRFGATDEVGLFAMEEKGLVSVENPSALLLEERPANSSGSVITAVIEGSRSLLVEVQALVNKTAFGFPVRKASGFDTNRLQLLIAVLEKRANIPLGQYDVHINVVGGIKLQEPAADLAVCAAIVSAFTNNPMPMDAMYVGEVGLAGEVRRVSQIEKRIKEAKQFGVKQIFSKKTKGANDISPVDNVKALI